MYQHRDIPQPKWDAKNKKWVLSIMIDGKRKQFVSRTPKMPGKRECRERCQEWIENGANENGNKKLSLAYEQFIQDYHKRYGDNEQIRQLKSLGKLYIIPKLGNKRCENITIDDWQSVLSEAKPIPKLRKDGSEYDHRDHLSKKYLTNIRGCIVSFCKWGLPRGYVKFNPSDQIYIPKSAPTIGKGILQLSDIEKVFQHPLGLWYERAVMLEILTGLRPGEVLGLQRQDYDKKSGTITIQRSINTRGIVTSGKNKNAHRMLALTDEVRSIIEEQLKETDYLDSEWIFCGKIGTMPSQESLRDTVKIMVRKHDLPDDITPYSLRHTFYSHTEAYLPDRIIKTIFGHSEKTDGHSIYGAHSIDGEAQEAARRLSVTPLYKIANRKENAE